MTRIILIGGKAKSGKDTCARFFKEYFNQRNQDVLIIHYSDLLKFICTNYFNWNGVKDEHGRELLQRIGTDIVRKQYPTFWSSFVIFMVNLFKNTWDYVIIPDARFPDEIDGWKENAAGIEDIFYIRVERPGFDNGLSDARRKHESEVALDNYPYDCKIINDSDVSLDQLRNECRYICSWIHENLPLPSPDVSKIRRDF